MKTEPCKCCQGSGKQLDNKAVAAEMKKLRLAADLSLAVVGRRMKPALTATYLWDLEKDRRNWNVELIAAYQSICK